MIIPTVMEIVVSWKCLGYHHCRLPGLRWCFLLLWKPTHQSAKILEILKKYHNRKGWIQKLGFALFHFQYPNFQDFNLIPGFLIRHGQCIQIISQTKRTISAIIIHPFSVSNRHFLSIRFDTWFPDTIGCMYSKSICNFRRKADSCWSGKMSG